MSSAESWQRGAERKSFRCLAWMPITEAKFDDGHIVREPIRLEEQSVKKGSLTSRSKEALRMWQQTIQSYHDYKSIWRAQMEALWLSSSLMLPAINAEFCDSMQGWRIRAQVDQMACLSLTSQWPSGVQDGSCLSSSHVDDRWCSSSGIGPTLQIDEENEKDNKSQLVPVLALRPNNALTVDFDDIVPSSNGNIIPPPDWRNSPVYRMAINAGVAIRDGGGRLIVSFRSWLIVHGEDPENSHRDFSMRPQLLVHLPDTARRLWRDRISRTAQVIVHVVRPSPMQDPADPPQTRLLHLIVEVHRPRQCPLQPVLIAVREISAQGVAPPQWNPRLLPDQFGTHDVWISVLQPCEQHQLLVPMAGRIRRWLNPYHVRDAVPGLFLPVWFDRRLALLRDQPYQDGNSLLQIGFRSQPKTARLNDSPQDLDSVVCPIETEEQRLQFPPHRRDDTISTATFLQHLEVLVANGFEHHANQVVQTYGLHVRHIGQREIRLPNLETHSVLMEIRRAWNDVQRPFQAILAKPPPNEPKQLAFIVEFHDVHHPPAPGTTPTLRRIFRF